MAAPVSPTSAASPMHRTSALGGAVVEGPVPKLTATAGEGLKPALKPALKPPVGGGGGVPATCWAGCGRSGDSCGCPFRSEAAPKGLVEASVTGKRPAPAPKATLILEGPVAGSRPAPALKEG